MFVVRAKFAMSVMDNTGAWVDMTTQPPLPNVAKLSQEWFKNMKWRASCGSEGTMLHLKILDVKYELIKILLANGTKHTKVKFSFGHVSTGSPPARVGGWYSPTFIGIIINWDRKLQASGNPEVNLWITNSAYVLSNKNSVSTDFAGADINHIANELLLDFPAEDGILAGMADAIQPVTYQGANDEENIQFQMVNVSGIEFLREVLVPYMRPYPPNVGNFYFYLWDFVGQPRFFLRPPHWGEVWGRFPALHNIEMGAEQYFQPRPNDQYQTGFRGGDRLEMWGYDPVNKNFIKSTVSATHPPVLRVNGVDGAPVIPKCQRVLNYPLQTSSSVEAHALYRWHIACNWENQAVLKVLAAPELWHGMVIEVESVGSNEQLQAGLGDPLVYTKWFVYSVEHEYDADIGSFSTTALLHGQNPEVSVLTEEVEIPYFPQVDFVPYSIYIGGNY